MYHLRAGIGDSIGLEWIEGQDKQRVTIAGLIFSRNWQWNGGGGEKVS
jgi:hypothetical protein